MNFFEHQDDARRSTRRLVILFSLAVVSLIVITNVALIASLWFFDASIIQKHQAYVQGASRLHSPPELLQNLIRYFDIKRVLIVSACVVGVIAFVILGKRSQLSGGGQVIAKRLGGQLISPDSHDPKERVVLNVVEEMAIASGTAVPPVYLLPENSINAFAAGFNPSDAVIGISRGAVESLSREQLQGVVAHEFSHIFNGDMRLNINLIAVLAGILFIGHAGWFIVRIFGVTRSRRSSRNSGSAVALVGLLLVVIGFLGTFFGKLIKAAVSRQREFLADASAVQFTRNPDGIGGALKLIGGSRYGSSVNAANAEEMSHMFFSDALTHRFSNGIASLFATHPPLEERINRIEPNWDGMYLKMAHEDTNAGNEEADRSGISKKDVVNMVAGAAVVASLEQSVNHVGDPDSFSQEKAVEHLEEIGENVRESVHNLSGAKALMYLLLLDKERDSRIRQQNYLSAEEDDDTKRAMMELHKDMDSFPKHERLDLVELAIPALKTMDKEGYKAFLKNLVFLVKSDSKIEVFEWLLHSLLVHYLKPHFDIVEKKRPYYKNLKKLRNECKFLLSYLSYYGEPADNDQAGYIFSKGFESLDLGKTGIVPKDQLQLSDLNGAIYHFAHLYPLVKPRLLKACAICIQADGQVTVEEFELLRVLSALIDCPMPLMELDPEDTHENP